MVKSKKFRRSTGKVLVLVLVTLVLYNEFLSYSMQKWFWWPQLHCGNAAKCVTILLVADPQLLGEQYESGFPKSFLTRWDSDSFCGTSKMAVMWCGLTSSSADVAADVFAVQDRLISVCHGWASSHTPGPGEYRAEIPYTGVASTRVTFFGPGKVYLLKTFCRAVDYIRPDIIMFLGDLMDEGSIASDEEYNRYLYRFHNIFHVDPSIKLVFVPGDNDVGGEDQPLTLEKLKRFQESFPQPDVMRLELIDMFKVNRLAYSVPKPEQHGISLMGNRTRIVLTHLPLLFLPSTFVQQVSTQLRPHLIFSAHDHKSLHIAADLSTGEERVLEVLPPASGRSTLFRFPLGQDLLHEIMVPTCSYRMGVYDMGYGAAVIDVEKHVLNYAVLWLPSRFTQLLVYGVVGALLFVTACTAWLRHMCFRSRHSAAWRTSLGV